ncbi:MAG: hypothetical protein ACLP5H_33210 [Desulfomonilaceae bacterium]
MERLKESNRALIAVILNIEYDTIAVLPTLRRFQQFSTGQGYPFIKKVPLSSE